MLSPERDSQFIHEADSYFRPRGDSSHSSNLDSLLLSLRMPSTSLTKYRAGILGLGFIGAADQVSGDALGQKVTDLDGTHLAALTGNPRIQLVAGASRD